MTASRFNGKTTAARERLAAAILAWSTLAPPHLCLASADVHSSFFAQLPTRSRGDKSYVLAHASSPFTKRERQTRFQTQKKRLALFPTRPWICRNRFWQCCWKRGKSQVKPTDYRKLDPAVQWLQCVSFQCFPRHFCLSSGVAWSLPQAESHLFLSFSFSSSLPHTHFSAVWQPFVGGEAIGERRLAAARDTMSALCAFPPLIPAGGGVYSAGYMADVSSSSARVGSSVHGSFSAYSNAMATSQQSRAGPTAASIPAYGSTFAAFHHHPSAVAAAATTGNGGKSVMKMTQPESAWSSRSSTTTSSSSSSTAGLDVQPPAAKRRCTDKMRSSTTTTATAAAAAWPDQTQMWHPSATIASSVCPSGCTMCHMQQQHQQQQQQQHQYPLSGTGFHQAYDSRRPLQEKHQNREESLATNNNIMAAAVVTKSSVKSSDASSSSSGLVRNGNNNNRTLSVDPKKDYSAPLHVDCSVEYDLPRIVRPPPGAQPLLILAPPRPSAVTSIATPTGYHPSTWTSSRPLPPQWNQQQQAATRIKSDKPSAASVKTHPAAIQQQQQQKLNSTSKSSIPSYHLSYFPAVYQDFFWSSSPIT